MNRPRATVVLPTWNRSAAIRSTLDSVREQTMPDWELLVVSDGCTDDTEEQVAAVAAADPRIRLIRTGPHGHPSEPRNLALAQARGAVVAYLDHDDRWRPEHLAAVVRAVEGGAELVATGFVRRTADGRTVAESTPLLLGWHPEIQLSAPLFEPSRVAHRAGLVERVGGWRAGDGLEDWDLWLRLADAGHAFTTLPARTALLHEGGETRMHRTPRRWFQVLAVVRDGAAARAAQHLLGSAEHTPAFAAAAREDLLDWYGRMAASGLLVTPDGRAGDLTAEIRAETAGDAAAWPDLVLLPHRGRVLLTRALWCSTGAHAQRLTALLARTQARQLTLLERLLGPLAAPPDPRQPPPGSLYEAGRTGRTTARTDR